MQCYKIFKCLFHVYLVYVKGDCIVHDNVHMFDTHIQYNRNTKIQLLLWNVVTNNLLFGGTELLHASV